MGARGREIVVNEFAVEKVPTLTESANGKLKRHCDRLKLKPDWKL
jgi:hypothetical protein